MAKVLLVEDDNNLREIYEARLQAEGYDIVAAHDGEEALVVAKNETPDLIISDVMMPKISGFEMLDILRNTDGLKDVKIIMLTALGQSDDQQRADRLGANRYLVKSQVTLEDIVKVAQELLAEGNAPAPATPELTPVTAPVSAVPAPAQPVAEAITVQPEPVLAATPAPEVPVMTLATPPADDPLPTVEPATTAPTSQPGTLNAQLTTDEEANVESQIEDFVQGASTDATPTEAEAAAVPQPVVEPTNPVTAEPANVPITPALAPDPDVVAAPAFTPATDPAANSASDDKLITDAIDTFAKNTASEPAPLVAPSLAPVPGSSPAIVVASGLPTPQVPETPGMPIDGIPTPEPSATADSDAQAIVARKKVIEPLNGTDKPDLDALLAREAANEAAPATVIAPTTPTAQPTDSSQTPTIDPNSIAL